MNDKPLGATITYIDKFSNSRLTNRIEGIAKRFTKRGRSKSVYQLYIQEINLLMLIK